ncbi:alpha/beta hydrolase [Massilia sp. TS11]|uniref:alpha/beta hydrolase n=1 Tax=Massilia sp. TS11 TaxID=2908003 RepID=UPI001ED9E7F3|nr:alpha/beta hydrolase [Massilia sp. TS11]MCG2583818.1 alpha/beta hydrolase [Massilia sp. TS11]
MASVPSSSHVRTVALDGVDLHCRVLEHTGKPTLLLLHGYPENHRMWHRLVPALAPHFSLVLPDLRGYGRSSKPASLPDAANQSKRAMAADMAQLMTALGYAHFHVAGHDRGARVTHRLAQDHAARVLSACVMDIAPTLDVYARIDQVMATAYFHWFFLIQPAPLPERMIGADPRAWLLGAIERWSQGQLGRFDPAVLDDYVACFSDPETIRATCDDYRAGAGIDLEHDRADLGRPLPMPLLVLWGARGIVGRRYDLRALWDPRAEQASYAAIDCGHFLPEEAPEETAAAMLAFYRAQGVVPG